MNDFTETIFNYDITEAEREALRLEYSDQASYLRETQPLKRFSDLHLFFLMRNDQVNRSRIIEMIKLIYNESLSVI